MGEDTLDLAADLAVEAILRDELARENRAAAAVVPVLRHLLASDAQALVSDAVLARVRGMIGDCAAQMLTAMNGRDTALPEQATQDHFAEALLSEPALLTFCHTLATESLLAERFQQRHAIDPVLSPLLQELIASDDPAIAALAMTTLAAQSRFMQSQRRMELPLGELPAELFHAVIALGFASAPDASAPDASAPDDLARAGLEQLQRDYDEAASRLGLLARLVAAMRRGVVATLALDHAGMALFASGLAAQTRLSRDAGVLACHEGQGARLALTLRSAGVPLPMIERQFLLVEPAAPMPRAMAALPAERAAVLLGPDGAML
jgi:hypothetical protein